MAVPPGLRLKIIRGSISYADAVESEDNVLKLLSYPKARIDSCVYLLEHLDTLAAIVANHLHIDPRLCKVTDPEEWNHGSFNWSVPVCVDGKDCRRVVLRIPLPYKFDHKPRRTDEKTRCEAATYAMIQEKCPDVPIPKLWGFGLADGTMFTRLENLPILSRLAVALQNMFRAILGQPIPYLYATQRPSINLGLSYLLLDYVEGTLLSDSFEEGKDNLELRRNLFTDLSRIRLSVGKIQHARIGSFTIDNKGIISLSNRPLTLRLPAFENEGVPEIIPQAQTYTNTKSYLLDMLAYHDGRILYQPNSVNDEDDAQQQMETLCQMRSILPHSILPGCRNGPFWLTLTDIHAGNIFVHKDWRIQSIIDLEGAATLPLELMQPPFWITGKPVDDLTGSNLTEYEDRRTKFMSIYSSLEQQMFPEKSNSSTELIQMSWETGASWYLKAIHSNGLFNLFHQHIQKWYGVTGAAWRYWSRDADSVIRKKLEDRAQYLKALEEQAVHVLKSK